MDKQDKSILEFLEISCVAFVSTIRTDLTDGNHFLSTSIIFRRLESALYCNLVTKLDHETSENTFASL